MGNKDIKCGGYTWRYNKDDLESGSYSITDPDGNNVTAIHAHEKSSPINKGKNAWLWTRDFQSEEWKDQGVFTLEDALTKGTEHVHQYHVRQQANQTLEQLKKEGLEKEEFKFVKEHSDIGQKHSRFTNRDTGKDTGMEHG